MARTILFQILIPQKRDSLIKIVINPFQKTLGLKLPPSLLKNVDILLATDNSYKAKEIDNDFFLIDGPGEYEIKGVFIKGISGNSCPNEKIEKTIYTIKTKEVSICHLGDFNQKELTKEQIEEINQTEILMIPVGGDSVLDAKEALKIVNQIEPSLIIPMYFHVPKLNIRIDGVDKFLKEMGEKTIEPLDKLSIKKQVFDKDGTKIIVLKP